MIELRWVEKPKEQPIYDTGENTRVLQYRQQTGNKIAKMDGVAITITHEWTDWQDVPTVTEEDSNDN